MNEKTGSDIFQEQVIEKAKATERGRMIMEVAQKMQLKKWCAEQATIGRCVGTEGLIVRMQKIYEFVTEE